MVKRMVWERIGIHPTGNSQNTETPLTHGRLRVFHNFRNCPKIRL